MTAAFELSKPALQDRFEVTVYQQGWRLGGKGASGRGPNGRIEEHGLHIWMGFYENAFRVMREVYAELDRDPSRCPVARCSDAFSPAERIGVAHPHGAAWHVWTTIFPALPGEPGTPISELASTDPRHPMSPTGYLVRSAAVMSELFRLAYGDSTERSAMSLILGVHESVIATAQQKLTTLAQTLAGAGAMSAVATLSEQLGATVSALDLVRFRRPTDPARHRASEVLEVLLTCIVGGVRSGALFDREGFDCLDHLDFREFLAEHGASNAAVDSPFVRGLKHPLK